MKTVRVVSVVVSYNPYQYGFFPACLEWLAKTKLGREDLRIEHQVIVVDNASADKAPQRIRQAFPGVEVIETGKNLGYAGGNNVGIREAIKRGAEYIAIVTQDVFVESDWLLNLVARAESEPKIGIVQPLIVLAQDPKKVNSIGNCIHFLGYGYADGYQLDRSSLPANASSRQFAYASGACLLLSAKAIEAVGSFDEEMWMYNEDEDLGWRMRLAGYKQVLETASVVRHQYEFSRSITKMYYMDRNRLLVALQNYHWATLVCLAPAFVGNEAASLVFALMGGWWREKLAVWRYFLRPASWRTLFGKRRLRQNQRQIKEKKVVAVFTGQILFQDVSNPIILYVANPLLSLYWRLVRALMFW